MFSNGKTIEKGHRHRHRHRQEKKWKKRGMKGENKGKYHRRGGNKAQRVES